VKIYISGPIKGKEHGNREAFWAARVHLDSLGHVAITPFDCCADSVSTDTEYAQAMRDDIRVEIECDAIYLLDGWENSNGARIEFTVAQACGLKIYYQSHGEVPQI
jgi:hypothetical protein